jgi:hypothetical protein
MKTRSVLLVSLVAIGMGGCGADGGTQGTTAAVTFWKDVAPIYNSKCVGCHQAGGIGPFRLDNYADAKAHAATELARVEAGTMPPYFMVHDGSCGSFHDETTLDAAQKATIAAWVNGGQAQGTPVALPPRDQPRLAGAVDVTTPSFSPVAQGGQLAEFDEYRCFLMNAPNGSDAFLTGYDVTPGEPAIVHHVLGFVVDPQKTDSNGMTNAAIMQALDDESPDRAGWSCFGGAGDGVDITGLPVTWAPGQGIVSYPEGMGVPVHATDKLVIQIHYNLADLGSLRKSDSTTVHLRFTDTVNRELAFLLPDPFLESLDNQTSDSLPPQKASTSYVWTRTGRDLGLGGGLASVDLVAVMPHMHGRGIRQQLRIGQPGNLACAADLENWNFHWQEFYFYKAPPAITADTQIQVTCEYNTINDTSPVLPGWGTRNEMCLAVMMVALPPS